MGWGSKQEQAALLRWVGGWGWLGLEVGWGWLGLEVGVLRWVGGWGQEDLLQESDVVQASPELFT